MMALLLFFLLAFPFASTGAAERASDRQIVHILNRLAFGPTRDDLRHVNTIGIERYIAEQLAPDNIAEPPELTDKLAALGTLKLDPVQLFAEYGPLRPANGAKPDPEEQKARRQGARHTPEPAPEART